MQAGIHIHRLDGHDIPYMFCATLKELGKGSERVLIMPQQKASHVL